MGFITGRRDESSRYTVSIVGAGNSRESILSQPSKGHKFLTAAYSKILAVFAIMMLAGAGFVGALTSAQPANAVDIFEGLKDTFCSNGASGYNVEGIGKRPNTGAPDSGQSRLTPYEKYGMSGMGWTSWLGPIDRDGIIGNDDKGKFTGIGVVNAAGGNANDAQLNKWANSLEGKETNYPGFFNVNSECSLGNMNIMTNGLNNFIFAGTKEVVYWTNLIYQTAIESTSNIFNYLEDTITAVVVALRDAVYFAFLTPIIVIGALWMAWVGLVKKQSIQMAQGAVWMIGAAVASVAIMSNPMIVPNTVNNAVSSVSQAGMNAITAAAPGASSMCTAPTNSNTSNPKDQGDLEFGGDAQNSAARNNIRQMQCTMWYSFVYTPWAMGQFGVGPAEVNTLSGVTFQDALANGNLVANPSEASLGRLAGTNFSEIKLGGYTPPVEQQTWALYILDNKANWQEASGEAKIHKQRALLNVAASQLLQSDYNEVYRGDDPMNRMGIAGISLLASVGAGIMIVIVSVSIIILDIGVIILTLVAPLFFLAGVHPGMGRRIALGWVEQIVGLALKRIALSIFLSVMLVVYAVMLQSTKDLAWGISMILIVALSIGGLSYKDQIANMFSSFSLGGNGGMANQPIIGQGLAKKALGNSNSGLLGNALAAATGGFVGGRSATGSLLRERAQDKRWEERMGGGAGNRPNGQPQTRRQKRKAEEEAAFLEVAGLGPDKPDADGAGTGGGAGLPPGGNSPGAGAVPAGVLAGAGVDAGTVAATKAAGDEAGNAIGGAIDSAEEKQEQASGGAGERPREEELAIDPRDDANSSAIDRLRADKEGYKVRSFGDAEQASEDETTPLDRLRASNPDLRPKSMEVAPENETRELPVAPTAEHVDAAAAYDKRIDRERKKLSKNGQTASRTEAMSSLAKKDEVSAQRRQKIASAASKVSQAKNTITAPARELGQMASSFDKSVGSPVKKQVVRAGDSARKVGQKMEDKFDARIAADKMHGKVREQVRTNRQQAKEVASARKQELASVPKEFRNAYSNAKWGDTPKGRS